MIYFIWYFVTFSIHVGNGYLCFMYLLNCNLLVPTVNILPLVIKFMSNKCF